MRHIRLVSIFLALVALSLPTVAAQQNPPVRLPGPEEIPTPQKASLASIESRSGDCRRECPSRSIAGTAFPRSSFSTWQTSTFRTACSRAWHSISRRPATAGGFSPIPSSSGNTAGTRTITGPRGWRPFSTPRRPRAFRSMPKSSSSAASPCAKASSSRRRDRLGANGGGFRARLGRYPLHQPLIEQVRAHSPPRPRVLSRRLFLLGGVPGAVREAVEGRARRRAPFHDPSPRRPRLRSQFLILLIVNEYQAYLLQQPRSMAAAYFERVGKFVAEESGVPTAAEVLPSLLEDEAVLEKFLKDALRGRSRRGSTRRVRPMSRMARFASRR